MKKRMVLLALFLGGATLTFSGDGRPFQREGLDPSAQQPILAFGSMYGVEGPLLGEAHAIRGVEGDELPWEVAHFIKGRLDTTGRLRILFRGLVFADDPSVPPDLVGRNDETQFRGEVSCLTEDGQGSVVAANVSTRGFPATVLGDSFIDETLELPNPCIAPIVFVMAGSEDKWFAVTGFEGEEGTSRRR